MRAIATGNVMLAQPGGRSTERHDHVAIEIEFIAYLVAKQRYAMNEADGQAHVEICRDALSRFITDHIAWWVPTFGKSLEKHIDTLLDTADEAESIDALKALKGVACALRAWSALERIANEVEPSRQIIAPQIDTQIA